MERVSLKKQPWMVKWKSKQSLRNQIDSLVHRQTWPSETKENKNEKL